MSDAFSAHKDRAPQATIRTIKRILSGIGIRPVEKNVRFAEGCYSTRLEHPVIAVGTNGKGVSRAYSRASAHAEFIERTQSLALFGTRFGSMPPVDDLVPDAKRMSTADCLAQMRPLFGHIFKNPTATTALLADALGKTVLAFPYYGLSDRAVTYLPKPLLDETLGTNGMCAGNTAEEAMVQGLCEVFERHALRRVLVDHAVAPTIPWDELRGLRAYAIAERIRKLGFDLVIKDCTLGGTVPVVGVICLNRERTRYRVNFGSDPLLDVALQRCLTEVTQNYDAQTIQPVMKDLRNVLRKDDTAEVKQNVHLQYIKSYLNSGGSFPQQFFFETARSSYRRAFLDQKVSHPEMLRWLVGKAHALGHRIFVRNMSFLGFPTYHVYVPGMSELRKIDRTAVENHFIKKSAVRSYLLRLPDLSAKEIRACIELLEELSASYFFADYSSYSGLLLRDGSDMFEMSIDWLVTVLSLRIRDFRRAHRHLDRFLDSEDVVDPGEYLMCALFYLRKRADGDSDATATAKVSRLFGPARAAEVAQDLRDPSLAFRHLKLPVCGRCDRCRARTDCHYRQWKQILVAMKREFAKHPIDQAASFESLSFAAP